MTDKTTPEPETKDAEPIAREAEAPADPPVERVISDPASEPSPKYRLIKRERIPYDHTLTPEERAEAERHSNERGERFLARQSELDAATAVWKDRRKNLSEAATAARDEWESALRARHTGVERRYAAGERRAVVASAEIVLVRLDTGEVVEARAMDEKEQAKYCRQGDIAEVTDGATVPVDTTGEQSPAEPPKPPEDDTRSAGHPTIPDGWPKAWDGKTWTVQVEGEAVDLEESGVLEVYLRMPTELPGAKVGELVTLIPWLARQSIARAVKLLESKGLARCGEAKRWLALTPSSPAPEVPEPGKSDLLPEAGDIVRPRLSEPGTKADALLADAGEVASSYGIPG